MLFCVKVMLLKLTNDPPPLSEEYSIDQNVHYTTAFKQVSIRNNSRCPRVTLIMHAFWVVPEFLYTRAALLGLPSKYQLV